MQNWFIINFKLIDMLKSISLRLCTLIVLLFAGIYSSAQQVQVKGTVVEKSSGESIIGASVMEVGSNSNGTITDIDGNFTLSVASVPHCLYPI